MSNTDYLKQFLDDEEFKEVVDSSGHGETIDYTVKKFCKHYGVTAGDYRIPSFLIYMVYRRLFTNVDTSAKIRPIPFFKSFNKLFTQVRTGKQRYYMINTDFDLDSGDWDKFKESYSKTYGVRNGKKKQSKKSSTEEPV